MRTARLHFQVLGLLLSALVPLSTFAQEGRAGGSPSVRNEMEAIQNSLRRLNRQYADPAQKASSLEIIAAIQKHAETAKSLSPSKAAKLTGEEQTKYVGTFQKDINSLLKEITTLKDAITADKMDIAKAEIQKIGDLRNSSHKELGVETGGRGPRRGGMGQPPPGGQPPAPMSNQ